MDYKLKFKTLIGWVALKKKKNFCILSLFFFFPLKYNPHSHYLMCRKKKKEKVCVCTVGIFNDSSSSYDVVNASVIGLASGILMLYLFSLFTYIVCNVIPLGGFG